MKKILLAIIPLVLCFWLVSCVGERLPTTESTQNTVVTTTQIAKITTEATTNTTEGPTVCFGSENNQPGKALVNVLLDGAEIETWNSLLYARYDGIVADGYIMFMDPPYNEFPEYELKNDLKITIDGAAKPSVTVRDAVTHGIIGKFDTENIAQSIKSNLGAGRYIIVFDAKNYGTGRYADDCVVYSHYFFVTVS